MSSSIYRCNECLYEFNNPIKFKDEWLEHFGKLERREWYGCPNCTSSNYEEISYREDVVEW